MNSFESPPAQSISDAYKYCVQCGTPRESQVVGGAYRCPVCTYVVHFNPIVAVGVIVADAEGKVLLIRRNRDPGKGKLGLPGGFIDIGETAEIAACREAQEEIGVEIENLRYVATFPNSYLYQNIITPVLDIFFSADIRHGCEMLLAEDEVAEVVHRKLDQETVAEMAFESNRKAMEVYARLRRE